LYVKQLHSSAASLGAASCGMALCFAQAPVALSAFSANPAQVHMKMQGIEPSELPAGVMAQLQSQLVATCV
jgi:hypothetical protein